MTRAPHILAVGGAHIDRRGRVSGVYVPAASNPGTMREDVGGGVFNALRTTVRRGASASLASLRGGDAAAETVARAIREAGIEDLSATFLDRTTPSYTAILDAGGELMVGFADMGLYDLAFPKQIRRSKVREAIAAGVFLVAKDRAESGIVGDFNIERNISLPFLKRMSGLGVMKKRAERAVARRQIEELGIVCRSEKDDLATLSGGNQQKVMVARWMSQASRLFILDEPFQGVDISARRDIAAKLRASADGRATLIFVTEIDEALETADRILVMSEHTIVGEHRNADIDLARLLAEVAGGPLHGGAPPGRSRTVAGV